MNDLQKGLSISIVVHSLVLGAVCAGWIDKPEQLKTISLDFSILNFEAQGGRTGTRIDDKHKGQEEPVKRVNASERHITSYDAIKTKTTETAAYFSSLTAPSSVGPPGILSDNDGHAAVFGKEGSLDDQEGPRTGNVFSVNTGQTSERGQGGSSEGRTIRYGTGTGNEKTFSYIREGILKNVRYPERARRKGLQGRITLSFTVTEDGLTRDIKVVSGSGFSELDNNAKEAITRTTFSQKIPYKLYVILPIEYRLE